MKIALRIYQGDKEILTKIFDEGVFKVGRAENCDVILTEEDISRQHLEIRVTPTNVYISNLGQPGKILLNGIPVETGEVTHGDEIGVGTYRVIIFDATKIDISEPVPQPIINQEVVSNPTKKVGTGSGAAASASALKMEFPAEDFKEKEQPVLQSVDSLQSEEHQSSNRSETVVEVKPLVAKLIFTEGPRKGQELFLETFEITFGRSKKADVFLDDPKLSRLHAKISRVGMGYRLIDMNSRNGTYVNGVRILEHPLSSFDMIALGTTKIKFLIHDLVLGDLGKAGGLPAKKEGAEQTRSIQFGGNAKSPDLVEPGEKVSVPKMIETRFRRYKEVFEEKVSPRNRFLIAALIVAFVALYFIPSQKPVVTKPTAAVNDKAPSVKLPPSLPKEYLELSAENQRAIEGHYNSAIAAADKEQYAEALNNLKKIHEVVPYYKNSRELQDQYAKKLKEQQIAQAQEKAKQDEKEDLAIYLEDGLEYLKQGDFDRAGEACNAAIVKDPNNATATKCLRAVELKIRDIGQLPPEHDVEREKRQKVADLFLRSVEFFKNKQYQNAIDTAEQIRKIPLQGETQYLNEAKQIIDKAHQLQKEEFEPFLIQAKEKYAEGDFTTSRDLCEEMLKRDPAYDESKECLAKAKKQLNRLAKEAYTHGYILESMNRIEEAKQYWNRAKNYVRPGDEYYDKVNKKLDYYQ